MENTGIASETAGPAEGRRRARTAADWAGLTVFAVLVLLVGAFVYLIGPLLAITCAACEDGVRGPLRFADALLAVARVGVPLVVFGTVAGLFHPRGGARAGAVGLGALVVLFVVMLCLGQVTA
ncbi:hypothetical protein [Streptomyces sp. HUAS ZL42]|uniref:hypothetical protein n=1 Tax=Streptomyces sp. HUAS ZL42 TaxID=3231715 RepID=UPI00345F0A6D